MSFFATQFQILSDLHLETPTLKPQYDSFRFTAHANNVFLLGDIGRVKDESLFNFLRRTLDQNRGTRIFYILGNHEAYQTTLEDAVQKLRRFEEEAKSEYGGGFKFLHRDRYDIGESVTILGCPLWSAVQPEQAVDVYARLTDFNEERGIRGWTPKKLSEEHGKDLKWLNAQVTKIQKDEPTRQVLIATHHCPTIDPRATDPAHRGSSVSSGFTSDLSKEPCWTSPAVKMWAFGHTHHSCRFCDDETGKLVVSNQKGYKGPGQAKPGSKSFRITIVDAGQDEWQVANKLPDTYHMNELLADPDFEAQIKRKATTRRHSDQIPKPA